MQPIGETIPEVMRTLDSTRQAVSGLHPASTNDAAVAQIRARLLRDLYQNRQVAKLMGIPTRYAGKSFAGLLGYAAEIERAKQAIQANESLVVLGQCGSGKTHFAVAAMYEWFGANCRIKEIRGGFMLDPESNGMATFLPCIEFYLELKATFGTDAGELSVIQKYAKPEFLVIDDLGAEKISEWSRMDLYALIDRRYREGKITVLTSNFTAQEMAAAIDDRIVSRFHEIGIVLQLKGPDWRLAKGHAL